MINLNLNEKRTLILIFTFFFTLTTILMYMMIQKDLLNESAWERRKNELMMDRRGQTQSWPKVEINTRQ